MTGAAGVALSGGAAPALVAAAAVLLWPQPGGAAMRRAREIRAPVVVTGARRPRPLDPAAVRRRRWALAAIAGLAAAVSLDGVLGPAGGIVVAAGVERLLRSRVPDAERDERAALSAELPGACDLLAVCVSAGVPVGGALAAVGGVLPAPLGPQLTALASSYRLGAEPRLAWAEAPDVLAGLGRVLVRSGESGAAVAPSLRGLAADGRAEIRAATEAAVRRAGVWILAPLGLCFLPAFVCLGVVPLVLGIAADVFG